MQTNAKNSSRLQRAMQFLLLHELLLSFVLVAVLIVAGSLIGIENNKIITGNASKIVYYTAEPHTQLSFFANWDGVRYLSIAKSGYSSAFLTGFFPLYPVVISLLHTIIGSYLISGLFISWLSLVGAVYFYIKITKRFFHVPDNKQAIQAVLLFLLFPSGVYLLSVYTESLFAFVSLAAIYFALQRKYILSGLFALIATATHINGVFLLLLIAMILYEEKERLGNIVKTLVIGSLGLIAYMSYLIHEFHNPLEFIDAQKDHHWLQTSLLSHLSSFSGVDYIFALIIIVTVIYWWKRRKSFAIYSALYLLIPIVGGQFGGYPRYTLMVFPVEFMLYEVTRTKPYIYQLLLIVLSVSWTYVLLQFAAGYVIS